MVDIGMSAVYADDGIRATSQKSLMLFTSSTEDGIENRKIADLRASAT